MDSGYGWALNDLAEEITVWRNIYYDAPTEEAKLSAMRHLGSLTIIFYEEITKSLVYVASLYQRDILSGDIKNDS